MLGLGQLVVADICPDVIDGDLVDAELCSDAEDFSSTQRVAPKLNLLFGLLALALPRSYLKHVALTAAAVASLPGVASRDMW